MREISLTVACDDAERVIDRIIGLAPYGVLDRRNGDTVVLRVRGAAGELLDPGEYARLAGRALIDVREGEVPDAWQERRLLDYEPLIVAGICVRPPWAPAADGTLDLVIEDGEAFGSGRHVTTRASLELLRELEPGGPLADLGCGSGVLAIAAAKLGFGPVVAVDSHPDAVLATRCAASCNGVEIEVSEVDLVATPPPFAPVLCANVPLGVHAAIVARLPDWPDFVIASGFRAAELETVAGFYARVGLAPGRPRELDGWITCLLSADGR